MAKWDPSDAHTGRQASGTGPRRLWVEPSRVSRRQFLRTGALAVAGVAALTGADWSRPRGAMAQAGATSPVSNLIPLSTSAVDAGGEFCQGQSLLVGRHSYRFDYLYGMGNPPVVPKGLVAAYRTGLCDVVTELQRVERPTPFQTPEAVPPEYPDPPPANSFFEIDCYRLVQPLDDQQTLRVYEWCSFYCAQGSTIIVQVDGPNQSFQYDPKEPGAGPPVVVHLESDIPRLHFPTLIPVADPSIARGGGFFQADNRQQGFSTETLWTANLPVRPRQSLLVETFIPGAADPSSRTAQARFEVSHADGIAVVTVNQQVATSAWVALGDFDFENGLASVNLTNETGEPTGDTVVVANAVRWSNA